MATLDSVKVRDYMTTKLVTFRPDMEVMHAVHTLVEKGISGAPVVDAKGNLVGVLSQRDCLEVALTAAQDTCIAGPVAQYMSEKPQTVDPETNLTQLATMFCTAPFRRYPVIEKGISVFFVVIRQPPRSTQSRSSAASDVYKRQAQDTCIAGPVAQYMSEKPQTVDPETNLTQLATMFCTAPFRRYPVIENGQLVGQISRSDVLRAISQMC
eukprot:TRINITY_DN15455_c0_g1_i2.p1 TRINITY_DN15455_c0_g1~~TRINITY_DN15455_c0_g1_i2.p1  ORF type:complete len:225 (+),score=28.46 TRINITY_DN15455_c0_g1_i2:45-677(+)